MQNGRRPTTKTGDGELRDKILEWIKIKPIIPRDITQEQLAYLITRNIHRDGIAVPNTYNAGGVVSNVITQERIRQIVEKVRFAEVEVISTEIRNLLLNATA
jgi:hypothetical protein